ncbi:MAG: hypothetical protein ACLR8P_02180 [Clostridium fessum]
MRHLFDTNGYTDAFQKLLARETIRKQERNVVLAHQFLSGTVRIRKPAIRRRRC